MRQVDEEQAERLVNTYSDLILRLSYTYLHSAQDAEDICQTVFLKCLTSGQVFESRDHEKAWIIRTAVNACKDLLRSAHRQRGWSWWRSPPPRRHRRPTCWRRSWPCR